MAVVVVVVLHEELSRDEESMKSLGIEEDEEELLR